MDVKPFKLDVDELINDFSQGESTTLAEMKKIWLSKKFSFIFEASPSRKQGCFMQSLYAHCIGYMVSTGSLSQRLGGLYCLYCLYETQPYKPPFKVYLSLGELGKLKHLVIDAKAKNIKVVSLLVKSMLEKNMFLFGFVDMDGGSVSERVNELTEIQNAHIQVAHKKLFADTRIEHFIHMDLGMELDVHLLKKKSAEYASAKELAIREASEVLDVQNVEHIAEGNKLIGEVMGKIAEDWNVQKEMFYQQTGYGYRPSEAEEAEYSQRQECNEKSQRQGGNGNIEEPDADQDFVKELEEDLLSGVS